MIYILCIVIFPYNASAATVNMYREKVIYPEEYSWEVEEGYTDYIFEVWAKTPAELEVDEKDISVAREWGYKTIDEYSDNDKITLYATEKTLTIPKFLKETYINLGWVETLITLYAPDGRTLGVTPAEKQTYINLGWYERPVTTLYTLDGRRENFYNEEVDAQCTVGWYREKPVLLYTMDGRKAYFLPKEVEAQCNVGWYKQKPVTLYTLDGRSKVFPASEVNAQRSVGWYYKSEIDRMNELKNLAKSFYIGQKVWIDGYAYTPIGYVTKINGGNVYVVWRHFQNRGSVPYMLYDQYEILSAERITGITIGKEYPYPADKIKIYK